MEKIIFFDIDGTLLPEGDVYVKDEIVAKLHEIEAEGTNVVLCTGKTAGQAKETIKQLDAKSFVCSNGQEVQFENEEIFDNTMDVKNVDILLDYLNHHKIYLAFTTKEGFFLKPSLINIVVKQKLKPFSFGEIKLKKLVKEDIKQIWFFGDEEMIDEVQGDLPEQFVAYRYPGSLEIMERGHNKGTGIRRLLANLPQKPRTYAFGDGDNDTSMFKEVDYGIAMGNAKDHLKEQANYVTTEVDQDGILNGIEHIQQLEQARK